MISKEDKIYLYEKIIELVGQLKSHLSFEDIVSIFAPLLSRTILFTLNQSNKFLEGKEDSALDDLLNHIYKEIIDNCTYPEKMIMRRKEVSKSVKLNSTIH